MYPLEDTIAAIASARSRGGLRGILRLSGPNSLKVLEKIGVTFPVHYSNVTSGSDRDPEVEIPAAASETSPGVSRPPFHFETQIVMQTEDRIFLLPARIYCWPGTHSYTGQTSAEIHTLGVLPFLDRLLEKLCLTNLVRIAQPGEYTLRAFLSGRMDLTQAEAVLGTIDAQNPQRLSVALHQLAGGLARPLNDLRTSLFELLGDIEAAFDFAEEDIEFISASEIARRLAESQAVIEEILVKMRVRSASETVPRVVLYGAPNIGKSALFNALTHSDRALVFDVPGTTRDYVSSMLSLGGYRCEIVDTAGDFQESDFCTRDASEILNVKSQEIARAQRDAADIPLYCFDASCVEFRSETVVKRFRELLSSAGLIVLTRCDLISERNSDEIQNFFRSALSNRFVCTSSRSGTGLKQLQVLLETQLAERFGGESDVVASTQSRCRESLRLAAESLSRARTQCGTEFQELIAAEIRIALEQVGLIIGAVYTEDLLDSIFSRFCVGK